MMQAVADAARAAGGRVVGVTPQLLVDKGISDSLCHELVVTACMRERKGLMERRGDAFLTLPGGLGTFEEIFEIIVGKQLGYHAKPIALLNVGGYFDPLLAMIEHGIGQNFIKSKALELFFVAGSVEDAIGHFKSYRPPVLADKWFKPVPAAGSPDERL
jgi:uncharacterized protein (TIGR00730 family)